MTKFLCPDDKCKHGSPSFCRVDAKFKDGTTWTTEPGYQMCPRYTKIKEPKNVNK